MGIHGLRGSTQFSDPWDYSIAVEALARMGFDADGESTFVLATRGNQTLMLAVPRAGRTNGTPTGEPWTFSIRYGANDRVNDSSELDEWATRHKAFFEGSFNATLLAFETETNWAHDAPLRWEALATIS